MKTEPFENFLKTEEFENGALTSRYSYDFPALPSITNLKLTSDCCLFKSLQSNLDGLVGRIVYPNHV